MTNPPTESNAGVLTDTQEPDPAESLSPRRGRTPRNALAKDIGSRTAILWVWAAMVVLFTILEPGQFFTSGTFQTIFNSQEALLFLTGGLLCTMCVGEYVDLSTVSILGLTATMIPVLVVQHGWGVAPACVVSMAAAVLCGAFNGYLIVYLGVNVIIVTLGSSTFILGITLWMSHLSEIVGLPTSFQKVDLANVGGLPISFYYGVVLMLLFAYLLECTPLGRRMRFVGANREVARLSGIRVNRIRFGTFVMASILCGLGGLLATAGIGGFDPNSSQTYLLPTFATVSLGTAVIQPGWFNPLGTFIAIFFLSTGIVGVELLGAAGWVSDVFYGGVLVIAVTISTVIRRRLI